MDEKHLRTFLAIADTHSFHRAAARLNITQAAVSSRVRALEMQLDVDLFTRGPGGTALTEAGHHLRPYAEQMLSQWHQIRQGLGQQFANRIALRIGCQLSIWDTLLVDLTIWAEEELGKLPLTLNFDHESNALELLRNRMLDLTVTHETPAGSDLTVYELPSERMILMAAEPCDLNDPDLPLFLNLQLGPAYDAAVREQLAGRSGHLFLGNAAMALHYMQNRGGMAFLPERMAAPLRASGHLSPVSGGQDFTVPCLAVYEPGGPAASTVAQVLPGLDHVLK
ncbi:LysR family transcriptional regulator [Pelagimonas sp. KU-00592-HH]|uniref:LysR family transcriptional regulator n=1 Tax=Pelagimonas sp. KU-00592-HH TaxID=3127651 RepID=UPI0031024AB1